jgi:hypothetical protein
MTISGTPRASSTAWACRSWWGAKRRRTPLPGRSCAGPRVRRRSTSERHPGCGSRLYRASNGPSAPALPAPGPRARPQSPRGAGLNDISVETTTEKLKFGSGAHMWSWLQTIAISRPPGCGTKPRVVPRTAGSRPRKLARPGVTMTYATNVRGGTRSSWCADQCLAHMRPDSVLVDACHSRAGAVLWCCRVVRGPRDRVQLQQKVA